MGVEVGLVSVELSPRPASWHVSVLACAFLHWSCWCVLTKSAFGGKARDTIVGIVG